MVWHASLALCKSKTLTKENATSIYARVNETIAKKILKETWQGIKTIANKFKGYVDRKEIIMNVRTNQFCPII